MLSDWMGLRQATQVPSDCCGPRVSVDHCRCVPGASECRGVSSSKRVGSGNKGVTLKWTHWCRPGCGTARC
jgi:hypothetical protein